MQGRVLIVAGSDSGGGAGIQADIKTVTALGGFAMTAVTALTAQNTTGVTAIHEVPPEFVTEQMRVVIDDIGVDAVKTGMLHDAGIIMAVADVLDDLNVPVVVDPVMVAKGGAELLQSDATTALRDRLLPLAGVLTPNIPEAEALTGITIDSPDAVARAAAALSEMGAKAVLMKGGHLAGDTVTDTLFEDGGLVGEYSSERIDTQHTHGTGCTLGSAIAAGLAQGLGLSDAVQRARAYVVEAIRTAPGYGSGHGPLNHSHALK